MNFRKTVLSLAVVAAVSVVGIGTFTMANESILMKEIKKETVYIHTTDDAGLKEKAKDVIKTFFNITPGYDELDYTAKYAKKDDRILEINQEIELIKTKFADDEFFVSVIKSLEKEKKNIESGTITTLWKTIEADKPFELYQVEFNDVTNEVMRAQYIDRNPKSGVDPSKFISIDQAKKICEDYIAKSDADDLKTPKFIGYSEYKDDNEANYNVADTFMLFYQDKDDSSKKVNLIVSKINSAVTYVSFNESARAEYFKNDIEE